MKKLDLIAIVVKNNKVDNLDSDKIKKTNKISAKFDFGQQYLNSLFFRKKEFC